MISQVARLIPPRTYSKEGENDTTKVLVCRSQIPSCYVEFEYKYWIWIWKKIKINVNDMKLWMHVKMKASKYYPNNITTACILYNFCIWYMRRFRKLSWRGGGVPRDTSTVFNIRREGFAIICISTKSFFHIQVYDKLLPNALTPQIYIEFTNQRFALSCP